MSVTLTINGKKETLSLPNSPSLKDLLDFYQIKKQNVIIEHNNTVYSQNNLINVGLRENDIIEILHYMGGG